MKILYTSKSVIIVDGKDIIFKRKSHKDEPPLELFDELIINRKEYIVTHVVRHLNNIINNLLQDEYLEYEVTIKNKREYLESILKKNKGELTDDK